MTLAYQSSAARAMSRLTLAGLGSSRMSRRALSNSASTIDRSCWVSGMTCDFGVVAGGGQPEQASSAVATLAAGVRS